MEGWTTRKKTVASDSGLDPHSFSMSKFSNFFVILIYKYRILFEKLLKT